MTVLLTTTQQALIDSAISALINNGNAPVDTANALDALRDAVTIAEAAISGGIPDDIATAMAALESTMDDMADTLGSLQSSDLTQTGQIEIMQSDMADQSGTIASLSTASTAHGAAIDDLENEDTAQDNALAALENHDAAQDTAISGVQSTNSTQSSQISGLQAADTATAATDATQSAAITAIQATDTAQDAAIAALAAALLNNAPTAPARSLATPYRISTTRPASIVVNVPITSAATLVLGSRGRLTVRYADDSGMTTNVVTLPTDEFGIGSGVLVTGYGILKVMGRIPANKWISVDTANVTGTPTYGSLSVQETVL